MASTPAVYPTSVTSFTTKVNHVDVYNDDHINKLQNELVATQTAIGTNPFGQRSNIADRLNAAISGSGGLRVVSAVPTETYPGLIYYRSDVETPYIIRSDNVPQAIGNSASNLLFEYVGCVYASEVGQGEVQNAGSLTSTNVSGGYRYLSGNTSVSFTDVTKGWLYKISGMTTARVLAQLWTALSTSTAFIQVDIGGQSGTSWTISTSATGTAPPFSIDISSLVNGTYYPIVIRLKPATNTKPANCSYVGIFGG